MAQSIANKQNYLNYSSSHKTPFRQPNNSNFVPQSNKSHQSINSSHYPNPMNNNLTQTQVKSYNDNVIQYHPSKSIPYDSSTKNNNISSPIKSGAAGSLAGSPHFHSINIHKNFPPHNIHKSTTSPTKGPKSQTNSTLNHSNNKIIDLQSILSADLIFKEKNKLIENYQISLELSYESGDINLAGQLASQIATEKLFVKQRKSYIESVIKQRQLEIDIASAVEKQFKEINNNIIDRAIEIEQIKAKFRNIIITTKLSNNHSNNNINDYYTMINNANKEIRNNELLLEQQCLLVDSIDLSPLDQLDKKVQNNGSEFHPLDFNLIFPNNTEHLENFNTFQNKRTECINNIQQQLSYLEELSRNLKQFHSFLLFLVSPTPFLQEIKL